MKVSDWLCLFGVILALLGMTLPQQTLLIAGCVNVAVAFVFLARRS